MDVTKVEFCCEKKGRQNYEKEQIQRGTDHWDTPEAEGDTSVKVVCARHNISEPTFYKWRGRYGGVEVNEARRLRSLEEENSRLKRLVADQAVQIQILKEVNSKKMVSPSTKRRAVKAVVEEGVGTTHRRVVRLGCPDRATTGTARRVWRVVRCMDKSFN